MNRKSVSKSMVCIMLTMLIAGSAPLCSLALTLEPVTPTLTLQLAPSAPTGLEAVLGKNISIALTWDDNSMNETSFVLQRKVEGGSYYDLATLAAGTTNYTDILSINMTMFGKVYYRVMAVNSIGSTYSDEVSVTLAQPDKPSNLLLAFNYASGKGVLTLSWIETTPELTDYYIIHRSVNGGAYSEIGTTDKTTYNDTGLEDATTYAYQVEVIGYVNTSNSEIIQFKTPEAAPAQTATPAAVSSGSPDFSSASDWAEPELQEAYDLDLTTDSILSNYSKNITREEFCEIAVKLYEALSGKTALTAIDNPFADTTNTTVLKAFNLGIIKGTSDTTFSPKSSITRQEICVMIYRTLKAADPDIDSSTAGVSAFSDETSIASWAIDAVRFANKNGIMKGTGGGNINPLNNTSREQAIVLLKRTYDSFQ